MAIHPAFPPLPTEALSDLQDEARRFDALLVEIVRRGRRATCELAYALKHVQDEGLYRAFGAVNAADYAVKRGFMRGRSKGYELIALVEDLERLDDIRAAFQAGELDWTKARTMASVATREDQQLWLGKKNQSNRELENDARAARGLAPKVILKLELEAEELAEIEAAADAQMKAARRAGTKITRGQALARACRSGGGGVGRRVKEQIVKYHCQSCGDASMETREGPVPVSPASLAASYCEAQQVDVTGEPQKPKRTIPTATRLHALARAKYRCEVEGCPNRDFLFVHHEGGWQTGHDPDLLHVFCWSHHLARHDELVRIEGTRASGIAYTTADGTPIRAHASAPAWPVAEAVSALKGLGLRVREAGALVERAIGALEARGQAPDLQELIREALAQLPTPGARVAPA